MSIFPAYSQAEKLNENNSNESWLQNTSFKIQLPNQQTEQSTSGSQAASPQNYGEETAPSNSAKSKKKIGKSKKTSEEYKTRKKVARERTLYIDNKSTKEFLTMNTIPKNSDLRVRYNIRGNIRIERRNKNVIPKFPRYFHQLLQRRKKTKLLPESSDSVSINNAESNNSCEHETELRKTTAFYNRSIQEEPNNVEMWLKFIDFQDTIFKSEKPFRKGSVAKGLQVNAERKLDIVVKALSHNPNSEDLHRKRLQIMVSVFSIDEIQKRLKMLLEKDDGNIILWQGYIEATLCSMSHCNTSSVLKLYTNCLSTLHKLRRGSIVRSKMLEESILRMLYHCGLFLKQSGLFEQLWTLVKMYLEMNLGQMVQDSFEISTNFKEKEFHEIEDMVFNSLLPGYELWLRIEKLRESCHWLPVKEQCEDPQRIVFTSDVVELIQPITMPENTFKLTAIILTLLKIPLVPCRHNTMEELGLDYVPWSLDSIETLLPIFYPIYPVHLELCNFFIDYELAVGPQYLKVLPGQDDYLNFILNVLQKCIDCSQGENKSALIVWWFRFQRLLIMLNNKGKFRMPPNMTNIIKSKIKTLMKKAENRNNILFYVEYALVEKELNSADSCVKILKLALTFTKQLNIDPTKIEDNERSTCYLVRILVEAMIEMGQIDKAIRYLSNFVLNKPITSDYEIEDNSRTQACLQFKHVTLQLLSQTELKKLPAVEHFLPIFLCDWVICYGWFIFLTQGPLECGKVVEEILEKLNDKTVEKVVEKEILFEFYVAVMLKFTKDNPGCGLFKLLDDVLHRAVQYFPTNSFFLSVLAEKQLLSNSLGPKWWNIKSLLLKTGHALPVVLVVSVTLQTIINMQEQEVNPITGTKIELNGTSFKNVVLSLFREATGADMCTRRCGLVWRLYLQFIHKYFDMNKCREIYYLAVEECPWLKALYVDAAIYIPNELSQIHDLIIEKQLRLHITPEELDILRDRDIPSTMKNT